MLLTSEDKASFRSQIEEKGSEIWASYRVEGRVNGQATTQEDRRMFASEQEAYNWLVGEAEQRGFHNVQPAVRKG